MRDQITDAVAIVGIVLTVIGGIFTLMFGMQVVTQVGGPVAGAAMITVVGLLLFGLATLHREATG